MIETRSLVKSFGYHTALAGVDLQVDAGEFVTLLGPNGAGKTTLLRILATLTRPTSGTVRVAGLDTAKAGEAVRRCVGFVSHCTLLYDDLTAQQNLRFYARLYDLDRADASARILEVLEQVGLTARRHDLLRTLSHGMKRRLAVARAILHRPKVLLLDEPYTGLDPEAAQRLTDLLVTFTGEGGTILLATHSPERGLRVGQRVVALSMGRIVQEEERGAFNPAISPEIYRTPAA